MDTAAENVTVVTDILAEAAPTKKSKKSVRFSTKKRQSSSQRAGLIFPSRRVARKMKEVDGKRVGKTASVYAAAVLEYLVSEVLELSGNACKDNGKRRIIPRHIKLALDLDEELRALTKQSILPGAGVVPNAMFDKTKKDTIQEAKAAKKLKKKEKAAAAPPVVEATPSETV